MTQRKRLASVAASALLLFAPALAAACPQCAGREDGGNAVLVGAMVAMMVALPYGVTAIVLRIIRRQAKEDAEISQTDK